MSERLQQPDLASVEVGGMTRGAFILRSALAAGALYGAGAVTPFVERAFAQTATSDLDIINFALTLEYVEAAFYTQALAKAKLSPPVKKLATELQKHETAHATALMQAVQMLGGKPAPKPTTKFTLKNEAGFLKLAATLEDTGVSAYNGAAPSISSPDLLVTAGTIVQVEARHAAAVRFHGGQDPAPNAFDPTLTAAQVTARIKPFVG